MRTGDIVLFIYSKYVGKGDYRLARVLDTFADSHGVVRTVKIGFRRSNTREALLPYISRPYGAVRWGSRDLFRAVR